jgi:hypothetical protein
MLDQIGDLHLVFVQDPPNPKKGESLERYIKYKTAITYRHYHELNTKFAHADFAWDVDASNGKRLQNRHPQPLVSGAAVDEFKRLTAELNAQATASN